MSAAAALVLLTEMVAEKHVVEATEKYSQVIEIIKKLLQTQIQQPEAEFKT
jgi:hypothetical protein